MMNYGYINNRAKFTEIRPISQTSLNVAVFGKNECDFRGKEMFQ